jgi:hypothetical protein
MHIQHSMQHLRYVINSFLLCIGSCNGTGLHTHAASQPLSTVAAATGSAADTRMTDADTLAPAVENEHKHGSRQMRVDTASYQEKASDAEKVRHGQDSAIIKSKGQDVSVDYSIPRSSREQITTRSQKQALVLCLWTKVSNFIQPCWGGTEEGCPLGFRELHRFCLFQYKAHYCTHRIVKLLLTKTSHFLGYRPRSLFIMEL